MTRIRCAIYTRKSSDEGLDQDFNSLDAQREACEAYIRAQKHEGWKVVSAQYDDGGVSGGTLERPALKRLLEDIDAGRVDMIVVYKIDRLTRSLPDFAKLVDRLDASGASFVSVTQQFNTSTSMGRLTLNVLLSFAQFEREVTAERIRDKIAASKKKGMWMGGPVPLGYDCRDGGLLINKSEAETVRLLFESYLDLGCVRKLKDHADAQGFVTKRHHYKSGRIAGGVHFSRGRLYHLLSNPVYIGLIRHKDETYPGLHEAIIVHDLWEQVQARLAHNRKARASRSNAAYPSPLAGKVFDENGKALIASHSNKKGRRYRYYISRKLVTESGSHRGGWRIPAPELEEIVVRAISEAHDVQLKLAEAGTTPLSSLEWLSKVGQVEISDETMTISTSLMRTEDDKPIRITAPFEMRRRGSELRLCLKTSEPRNPDMVLIRRIHRAMNWAAKIRTGRSITALARSDGVMPEFVSNNLKFAFLSPSIIEAICQGRQRPEITTEYLIRTEIPIAWADQEKRFL